MTDIMTIEAAAPAPAPPPEPLRPVSASERVDTIDILRGLALFGILAANIRAFGGPAATYMMTHLFWPALPDRIVQAFIDTFIQGKFITIFAFLFGVGFAIQFTRATERGSKFGWTYARRLFVLLLFGLIHGLLIWWGDILLMYAVWGFVLLLFRKRRDKTVAVWAVIMLMILPLVMTGMFIAAQAGVKLPEPPTPTAADLKKTDDLFSDGSWIAIQTQRMKDAVTQNWAITPVFGWQILALFLLGTLAWRKGFFQPSPESLPRYRTAMWWGFAIGITGNVAMTALKWIFHPGQSPKTPLTYAIMLLWVVSTPALSLGYTCLVIRLCQSEIWRARFRRPAAIGRTALTNYLLQSVIGTLIFYSYGLGLFGDFGPAVMLPLTIAIYAMQLYLSSWWLERYRFGPVEWLWRRLTYRGPLPMRREVPAALPVIAETPTT